MIKKLYTSFILILIFTYTYGQLLPSGNIWVHSSGIPGNLGYFETGSSNYIFTDSIPFHDMIIYDSLILAGKTNLYIYSAIDGQKFDSILGVNLYQMDVWENNLVVTRTTQPFFKVFSMSNLSESFSLDSVKISSPGSDLLVMNDRAYVLQDTFVQVIDLLQQDTVARIQTEHPFPFGGMNRFIVKSAENLFIDVEYATGAIRSSMLEVDPSNLTCTTLYHLEGAGNLIPPVVIGDKLLIMNYPSYYDLTNDSLHALPWSGEMKGVIDYDNASNHLFIYDFFQHSIHAENYSTGDSAYAFFLNGFLNKALFYSHQSTTGIVSSNSYNIIDIFPQPANDHLFITFKSSVSPSSELLIFTMSGNIVDKIKLNHLESTSYRIDVSHLVEGIYVFEIDLNGLKKSGKFLISR